MRALVTGAASGLGAALVTRLTDQGAAVLATDIGKGSVPFSASDPYQYRPGWLRVDVRSDADWAAALAWVEREWGGVDLLVNNAGIAGGGRIDRCTIEEWSALLEVNLLGVVRGCRTFAPLLKRQGSGRIVNVASLAGLVHPPGMAAYNASKAAVVALSETLGHELAPYGVGCTAVCPSYFRTNLTDSLAGGRTTDDDVAAKVSRLVSESPIGADEIAAAVLAAVEDGTELLVPDEPARVAVGLKATDRAAYDAQMRRTAARMKERDP